MTDGPKEFLLFAEGISKTYPDGDVRALNGVTLGVREAEYVAITGRRGCGKSTLLNMLGALDRPDSGRGLLPRRTASKDAATSISSAPGRSGSCSSRSSCFQR